MEKLLFRVHIILYSRLVSQIKRNKILAVQIEKKNNLMKEMKNKKKIKAESFYGLEEVDFSSREISFVQGGLLIVLL